MVLSPVYFFTVFAVLTMSIVYKGSPSLNLDDLPSTTVALAIVLTALVGAILAILFWLPYVYAKVVRRDYTLRWWHIVLGPALWKRPTPPSLEGQSAVTDYRVYGREGENATEPTAVPAIASDAEKANSETTGDDTTPKDLEAQPVDTHVCTCRPVAPLSEVELKDTIVGSWILPRNLLIIAKRIPKLLTKGATVDVNATQMEDEKTAARLREIHERGKQYDNDTEHMYTYLQVLTACVNSFAHGANDVSNAVGPLAAIYYIWSEGRPLSKDTPTPTWILVFGAVLIVIGLATYGYKIMAALGNRLTLHSPSRGFSMQFGASLTVLLASQYGIPVSSTMCLAGATAGVGLVSGGPKAVNWRAFGWIVLGWVLTVPVAGTAAGCLFGLFINAPHW